MSEEAPEVDQGTSLNTCAESACALLDRLATAPLSQLDAPELVDQCSDVLSYVYRLNESTKSTKDIILTAWARVRSTTFYERTVYTVPLTKGGNTFN